MLILKVKKKINLNNAKTPSFKIIPANITEPVVGASTCASGNQIWTGNIGTLTAKEQKKLMRARQAQNAALFALPEEDSDAGEEEEPMQEAA